jgi:hypothetical protein
VSINPLGFVSKRVFPSVETRISFIWPLASAFLSSGCGNPNITRSGNSCTKSKCIPESRVAMFSNWQIK